MHPPIEHNPHVHAEFADINQNPVTITGGTHVPNDRNEGGAPSADQTPDGTESSTPSSKSPKPESSGDSSSRPPAPTTESHSSLTSTEISDATSTAGSGTAPPKARTRPASKAKS